MINISSLVRKVTFERCVILSPHLTPSLPLGCRICEGDLHGGDFKHWSSIFSVFVQCNFLVWRVSHFFLLNYYECIWKLLWFLCFLCFVSFRFILYEFLQYSVSWEKNVFYCDCLFTVNMLWYYDSLVSHFFPLQRNVQVHQDNFLFVCHTIQKECSVDSHTKEFGPKNVTTVHTCFCFFSVGETPQNAENQNLFMLYDLTTGELFLFLSVSFFSVLPFVS